MLLHALAGGSLSNVILMIVAFIIVPIAIYVVKAIHTLDNKITNPEAKLLLIDSEEAFFTGLSSILAQVKLHANTNGVPIQLVLKGLEALVNAEKSNPFTSAVPSQSTPAAPPVLSIPVSSSVSPSSVSPSSVSPSSVSPSSAPSTFVVPASPVSVTPPTA